MAGGIYNKLVPSPAQEVVKMTKFGRYTFLTAVVAAFTLNIGATAAVDESWSSLYSEGEDYLSNQRPALAETCFRKALKSVKKQSTSTEDFEKCLRKLADTLVLRDKTAEAMGLYQQVLTSIESKEGPNSSKLVPLLFTIGSIQEGAGNHGAAMVYYRKAVSISERNWGPYSPQISDGLQRLGRAAHKAGDYREAGRSYKQAIEALSKDPSLDASARMETARSDYANLIKNLDDSDRQLIKEFQTDILRGSTSANASDSSGAPQAQLKPEIKTNGSAWQQQTIAKMDSSRANQINEDPRVILRGAAHPTSDTTLAPAYKTVEDTIFTQDRFDKAEDNYKRTIAADLESLGANHPAVANDLVALAQLYLSHQRYADAQPLLRRALAIYEQVYGAGNALTVKTRSTLASAELHTGNVEGAANIYRNLLSSKQASLGPNNLETANALNQLAYVSYQQGKLEDARTFYEWALASTEGATGQQDPLVAACLKDYAKVLRSLGRDEDASAAEARAEKILASKN